MFGLSEKRKQRKIGVIAAIAHESGYFLMRGGLVKGTVMVTKAVNEFDDRVAFLEAAREAHDKKAADGVHFVTNATDTALQGLYRSLPMANPAILGTRTILFEALDAYNQLKAEGRLSVAEPHLDLRQDSIETVTNDRGQNTYRVNWDAIKPQVLGTLLICHAVAIESPYTPQFLTELYDLQREPGPEVLTETERAFKNVTERFDALREANERI